MSSRLMSIAALVGLAALLTVNLASAQDRPTDGPAATGSEGRGVSVFNPVEGRIRILAPVAGRVRYDAPIGTGAVVQDGQLLFRIVPDGAAK